jgi:hypothetical protein
METPELAMEGIELALRGVVGEPAFTDAMENALIEAHTVSAQGRSSKSRQRRHSTAEDVPSEPKCDEGALRSRMERLNAKARTLERDLERHETQSEVLVAVAEVATRLVDQRQEARGAQKQKQQKQKKKQEHTSRITMGGSRSRGRSATEIKRLPRPRRSSVCSSGNTPLGSPWTVRCGIRNRYVETVTRSGRTTWLFANCDQRCPGLKG